MGSSADPSLNGHLKYPNNLDQSLDDTSTDKIRKYRPDYNNRPPSAASFIPAIASTSGRLHSEFVRILFLQAHRETDRFFAGSGVQLTQTHPGGQFTFRHAAFLTQLQIKVGLALAKAAVLRININLDGAPISSKSHTHPSHSQTSRSLSLHRHSYIGFILTFASSIHNKQQGTEWRTTNLFRVSIKSRTTTRRLCLQNLVSIITSLVGLIVTLLDSLFFLQTCMFICRRIKKHESRGYKMSR
jgi:hypothetical protein